MEEEIAGFASPGVKGLQFGVVPAEVPNSGVSGLKLSLFDCEFEPLVFGVEVSVGGLVDIEAVEKLNTTGERPRSALNSAGEGFQELRWKFLSDFVLRTLAL